MRFDIHYHQKVVQIDIPALPKTWREKIKKAIEVKLATEPELFGKPLRKSLKGYRKLRVGDYRIIFKIERSTIFILVIQHRSIVYKYFDRGK